MVDYFNQAPNKVIHHDLDGVAFDPRLGLVGSLTSIVLDPDDADAADADTERWTSVTGAIAFRVLPRMPRTALYSVVDVADNSTIVHAGPARLLGVRVETVLSAHALPFKDNTTTVFSLAASTAAGTSFDFFGTYFATSLVVDPDDAATGSVVVVYSPYVPLIFGWSTTASDLTAVNAIMATVDTGLTTPGSGGTEVTNTGILLPAPGGFVGNLGWVMWDGVTRIKTIAVRSSGADYPEGVVLQVLT